MGIRLNSQNSPLSESVTLSVSNPSGLTYAKSDVSMIEYKNPESLDKLCEALCREYNLTIEDQDELKSIVQNELSATITQFIDNRLLSKDNQINIEDQTSTGEVPKFVMTIPINDLWELSTIANRNKGNAVEIYIRCDRKIDGIVIPHQDDDGNSFIDTVVKPDENNLVKVGTITRDEANQWMMRIDALLPTEYVDLTMYTKCWLCSNNKAIRDFLNDIYLRINHKGKYSPIRESVEDKSNEDELTTYEIEYNPDEIIVYIKDNLDPDLNEDAEEYNQDDVIKDFFSAIFDTDDVTIVKVNESVSSAIIKTLLAYPIGLGAKALLNTTGLFKNITKNPNSDRYKAMINPAATSTGLHKR